MSEKTKRITIISLLGIIIVLLSILLFTGDNTSRTIMIYMVGSDLESKLGIATADLEGIDPKKIDLKHNNILLYTGGTTEWKNYISNEENALYILTEDGFGKIEKYDKENMGSPNTLTSFLNYGYDNYETDTYDLILYDHGGAISGAIFDDFTNDNLSLSDFSEALRNSRFNENNKLDVVLFDTCLNGTLEVANVFKDYANYLVASEEVSYGSNVYSTLAFLNDINNASSIDFGKTYINYYQDYVADAELDFLCNVTYSLLDLSKIDNINSQLDQFISNMKLNDSYKDILSIRSSLFQYGAGSSSFDTVDLYSLVDSIKNYSDYNEYKLINAIDDAVIYNYSNDTSQSHGISIYFPFNGSDWYQRYYLKVYDDLNFSNNYKSFINKMYTFKNDKKDASLLKEDIVSNITSSDGNVMLNLDDKSIKDFNTAILNVFVKTKDYMNSPNPNAADDIYTNVLSTTNWKKDNETILFTIDDNFVEIYDDDGHYGYLGLHERAGIKKQPERVSGMFGRLGLYPDTTYAKFYLKYENDVPKIRLAVNYDDDETSALASGGTLNINDYDDIYFDVYAYRLQKDGSMKHDSDMINYTINWHEKTKQLKLRKATYYDNIDYYAQIIVYDIYGNKTTTKLIKINK